MIEIIAGMPDNVLGFVASGKVTGHDYDTVLIPAIEAKLMNRRKVRVLYQIAPNFNGFSAEAMWDDAKVGLTHLTEFEKVAIVADADWIRHGVQIFRPFMPCPVKVFSNDQLPEAKFWITG